MDLSVFTTQNKFLMLALDQRASFKKLINPRDPQSVDDDEVVQIKSQIIDSLSDQFSSLLVDPEYGLPAYQEKKKPFLLCLEKSGYEEVDGERYIELESTVKELKEQGAAGAKLLLQFNPFYKSAHDQLQIAKEVLQELETYKLPLFLEIVTYQKDNANTKQELVLGSVDMFLAQKVLPQVFKLEYPGDEESCEKVTNRLGKIPWILLTGGEEFEEFKESLIIAVANGASGFLAGRSVWQEVLRLEGAQRQEFLNTVVKDRFTQISDIVLNK